MSNYRQRYSVKAGAAALGALLLLTGCLLASCGQSAAKNRLAPAGTDANQAAALLPSLPRPSSLPRLSSAEAPPPRFRLGADYDDGLPKHNVSLPQAGLQPGPEGALTFNANYSHGGNLGGTAYATFRIADQTGAAGPMEFRLDWLSQPAPRTAWVALANYYTDRWDWHSLPAGDGSFRVDEIEDYVANWGQSFVVVLLAGQQSADLSWLLLGEPLASAEVTASQQLDEAGLTASVDATASRVYGASEWFVDYDWENDGVFDLLNDADGLEEHLYSEAGSHTARVRVHDMAGAQDASNLVFVVPDGSQPIAQFKVDVSSGDAPLEVHFDASDSLPSQGASITLYEWDLDGDGKFERDTGSTPEISAVFGQAPGVQVSLRVSDSAALQDSASLDITLNKGWHVAIVDSNALLDGGAPALALVGPVAFRRPAVAYRDSLEGELRYCIADGADAHNWGSPAEVATGDTGYAPAMLDVGGLPAVAYNAPNEFTPGAHLFYTRALDTGGSHWSTPLELSEVDGGDTIITSAGGKPAIYSLTNKYAFAAFTYVVGFRAKDALGLEWNEAEVPDYVAEEAYVFGLSTLQLEGKPTLFYGYYSDTPAEVHKLRFTRAEQAAADTWLEPVIFGNQTAGYTSLALVNGRPGAAFAEYPVQQGVYYTRALDSAGGSWSALPVPVDVRPGVGASCSLAVAHGKPLVSYYDNTTGDLLAVFASDADGAAWGPPMVVDGAGDVGLYSSLINSASTPLIVYGNSSNNRVLGAYYE